MAPTWDVPVLLKLNYIRSGFVFVPKNKDVPIDHTLLHIVLYNMQYQFEKKLFQTLEDSEFTQ